MKDLRTITDNPERRPALVADCVQLIDSEVKSKTGLSGVAVKTAYALVKAIKPRMIENAVEGLLDDFTEVLQGFYQRFQEEGGGGSLEDFLGQRSDEVAEGLLSVTDARARGSTNKTLVKAYNKLRPKGKVHVELAVPRVGRMLDKYDSEL